MELTLVGLQYSGKTTFVNVIAVSDHYFEATNRMSLNSVKQSKPSLSLAHCLRRWPNIKTTLGHYIVFAG